MADIIFYEKPGCQGNARQKEILLASGHRLEVQQVHNRIGLALEAVGPRDSKNSPCGSSGR